MRRGTTPEIIARVVGYDPEQFDVIWLTIKQDGNPETHCCARHGTEITKSKGELNFYGDNLVGIPLTQEETLLLSDAKHIRIQLRAMIGTRAVASNIPRMRVGSILKEGVIYA